MMRNVLSQKARQEKQVQDFLTENDTRLKETGDYLEGRDSLVRDGVLALALSPKPQARTFVASLARESRSEDTRAAARRALELISLSKNTELA